MALPTSASLLLMSTVPGVLALGIGAALLKWPRTAGAIAATLFAMGVSLLALPLIVAVAYSSNLIELQQSPVVLLGLPLVAYAVTLVVLVRRMKFGVVSAVLCGVVGLAGLYYIGGFTLMSSACSFGSGGC